MFTIPQVPIKGYHKISYWPFAEYTQFTTSLLRHYFTQLERGQDAGSMVEALAETLELFPSAVPEPERTSGWFWGIVQPIPTPVLLARGWWANHRVVYGHIVGGLWETAERLWSRKFNRWLVTPLPDSNDVVRVIRPLARRAKAGTAAPAVPYRWEYT